MIEATCAACGTLNRVPEANVPAGAKFITCVDCKARVAIAVPIAVPTPAVPTDIIDLADLPAPKRSSAIGPFQPPASKAPGTGRIPMRAGLAATRDPELSAPRPARGPGGSATTGSVPALDLDAPPSSGSSALMSNDGGIDLPAPKLTGKRPPSIEQTRDAVSDLPAPRATREVADLPAPKLTGKRTMTDLSPTSAAKPTISDLPAPKRGPMIPDLPAPPRSTEPLPRNSELPAPHGFFDDLPQPNASPVADLPAPKDLFDDRPQSSTTARPQSSTTARTTTGPRSAADLPAPKGLFDDLPQPSTTADLPAPKGFFDDAMQAKPRTKTGPRNPPADVPAPKGFFDEAMQAKSRTKTGPRNPPADVPAPKGFFDEATQAKPRTKTGPRNPSADADAPAPKGFFDDLPRPSAAGRNAELPAPKGFFDDLPQVKSHPKAGAPEVPAPKGFFDDAPGLPNSGKPEAPAPKGYFDNVPGLPNSGKSEAPAPKGFFDDLPGRPLGKPTDAVAPKGFFDDLPRAAPTSPAHRPFGAELQDGPELELIAPDPGAAFAELERSESAQPAQPAQLAPTAQPAPPASTQPAPPSGHRSPPARAAQPEPRSARFQDPRPAEARDAESELETAPTAAMPKLTRTAAQQPAARPAVDAASAARAKARRKQLVLGGAIAVAVLGGGGALVYRRHAAAVAREAQIAEQLQIARAAYAAADPQHWQRAATAARQVVELDAKNPAALGIGAETLLAGALSDGTGAAAKLAQASRMLDVAGGEQISSPQLARARALSALAAHQPEAAIIQLTPLTNAAPKDGPLALYLGWALDAKGDPAAAVKAYDTAVAVPAVKLPALYGRGTAKLELAELEGARADFAAVLAIAKDHLGAQVGLAAAEPPSAVEQQEADLLAILARKDLAAADPRAVAQAWSRAGDAAKRAGRYDVARARFKKALAVVPQDLAATTGLADTELHDGKLALATELAAAALAISRDDVAAQLVQSELEVDDHKLPLATQRLTALAAHPTPLTPLEQARLQLITGRLLEAEGKDDAAVDAYVAGAKVAGDLDLAPMMAAIDKLGAMTTVADDAKNTSRAGELRARTELLLGALAGQAEHDPRLALRLGQAYLQSGNAAQAEPWLRKAADARPGDAEARLQLGRALLKAGKNAEALEALEAALATDPARADIGVVLARAYEALGRDGDAGALYGKLLASVDPSLELRGRAGQFYARTGAPDKAGAQGALIVAADPDNAAGLYLKGEGLLAAGRPLEAKQALQRAAELDRDPQYLDALGRAAEALALGGDRELQDLALRSYLAAAEAAPAMENPLAGQGRLYVARHEAAKAVPPLLAASKLEPQNAEVMFLIGASYQELQQPATALQWLEAAAKIHPDATTFWRMAQLYRDANQGPRASAALASATRLAAEVEQQTKRPVPWLTDALYLRGRVSYDLHDEATARDAWTRYVARHPPPSAQLTEVTQLLATALRH
ncbi:MAG TPA: tetratricopeptide repeat protein [Kofleriaceae bacterium]|nr:tetratricopeptide repeat protein [Kofleriaceae bacterium]